MFSSFTYNVKENKATMFAVVDFADEQTCEVVPTSWLIDENHKTSYPQYKGTRYWKAVTTLESPKSSWKTYSCRLLYQTNELEKAKLKRDRYQYLDTEDILTSTEEIAAENHPTKRICFPNLRYIEEHNTPSSDESLSENDNVRFNNSRTYISKTNDKLKKKRKVLPEPEPIQYSPREPLCSKQLENVDKENVRSPFSAVQITGMTKPIHSREIVLSEDKFVKILTMFEDIKYEISSIKRYLKKNVNTNTSNIQEEKLPEETEALIPVMSLENLTILNDYLKQKPVFDLYEKHLRCIGGTSQADHTRRVLKRIISNEVAQHLNWAGRGNKISFQKFGAVCQLILKSTSHHNDGSYKVKKTEETIKSWLRFAFDRDGGRKRRQIRFNNNNNN